MASQILISVPRPPCVTPTEPERTDQMSTGSDVSPLFDKSLPPLTSLFFYCPETLPELDSLQPAGAC